jgi:hypothetical protein
MVPIKNPSGGMIMVENIHKSTERHLPSVCARHKELYRQVDRKAKYGLSDKIWKELEEASGCECCAVLLALETGDVSFLPKGYLEFLSDMSDTEDVVLQALETGDVRFLPTHYLESLSDKSDTEDKETEAGR